MPSLALAAAPQRAMRWCAAPPGRGAGDLSAALGLPPLPPLPSATAGEGDVSLIPLEEAPPVSLVGSIMDGSTQMPYFIPLRHRPLFGADDAPRRERFQSFLAAVVVHANQFTVYHRAMRATARVISETAGKKASRVAREKERDVEREERARLKALKSNDMEAYAALLQQTKNSRLQFLLQQTESYLKNLSDLIGEQQASNTRLDAEGKLRAAKLEAEATVREEKAVARSEAMAVRRSEKAKVKADAKAERAAARAARKAGGAAAAAPPRLGAPAAAEGEEPGASPAAEVAAGGEAGPAAQPAALAGDDSAASVGPVPPEADTGADVEAPAQGAAAIATNETTMLDPAAAAAAAASDAIPAPAAEMELEATITGSAAAEPDETMMLPSSSSSAAAGGPGDSSSPSPPSPSSSEPGDSLPRGSPILASSAASADAASGAAADAEDSDASGSEEGSDSGESEAGGEDGVAKDRGTDIMASYYKSAHRTRERISTQPALLVGGSLKAYQVSGLEWMVSLYNNSLNGILADEMGLGKTVQTIALIAYLIETKRNPGPFMVTVPLSTMSNWSNEFSRWAPAIRVVQYKGTPPERKEVYKEHLSHGRYNVVLTTYEYVMKDRSVLRKIHWQYIIIDEGHRLKNAHCKFAQTLAVEYTSKNRLLLTGTPLQNSLPELWSLLNFLLPKVFNSVDNFEAWFSKPFASFRSRGGAAGGSGSASSGMPGGGPGEEPEGGALTKEETMLVINRLHQVLRPFLLRRLKSQVLSQLPEKTEHVIRCELSAWQRIMYKQIQTFGAVANKPDVIGDKKPSRMLGLSNLIMQLRKVANHPFLFSNGDYDAQSDEVWRSSGKFELLERMLPKLKVTGHRVLIFSQQTALLDIMEEYFEYRQYSFLRLDGSTAHTDREARMKAFNAPNSPYFAFILSTRAGGLGINLQTADTVIIFDSDWNPTADAQAQDRAHRIGQTREVRVFRLCTTTPIEERILARASDKASMEALVIEAGDFGGGVGDDDAGAGGGKKGSEADAKKRSILEDILHAKLDEGPAPARASSSGAAASPAAAGAADEEGDDEEAADESLVPSDMEINEMMARDEGEYKLFCRLDRERATTEIRTFGTKAQADKFFASLAAFERDHPSRAPRTDNGSSSSSSSAGGLGGSIATSSSAAAVGAAAVDVEDEAEALLAIPHYSRLLREEEVPAWVKVPPGDAKRFMAEKSIFTGNEKSNLGELAHLDEEGDVASGGADPAADGPARSRNFDARAMAHGVAHSTLHAASEGVHVAGGGRIMRARRPGMSMAEGEDDMFSEASDEGPGGGGEEEGDEAYGSKQSAKKRRKGGAGDE